MFNYGTTQTTKIPAPEIKLIAKAAASDVAAFEIDAVVDTGSSITCVPRELMKRLNLRVVDYIEVKASLDENTQYREVLKVHLKLAKCEFKDFRVIIHERNYALIGRDILNRYRIIFDGLNQSWKVEKKNLKKAGKTL